MVRIVTDVCMYGWMDGWMDVTGYWHLCEVGDDGHVDIRDD
jgi:hypothetical protein